MKKTNKQIQYRSKTKRKRRICAGSPSPRNMQKLERHIYNISSNILENHYRNTAHYKNSDEYKMDLKYLTDAWKKDITDNFTGIMEELLREAEDEEEIDKMRECIENYPHDNTKNFKYINGCYQNESTCNYDPEFSYKWLDDLDELKDSNSNLK